MEMLLVLLLISHIAAIIVFINHMKAYKENNYNYLNAELRKLDMLFSDGTSEIQNNLQEHVRESKSSYKKLFEDQNKFNIEQKFKINEVSAFIKKDYTSLSDLLKVNNDLLSELLEKTKTNILRNEELKPLLIESSDELEKVYDRTKVFLTNYEKNIKDIRKDIEGAMHEVEDMANGKIKQIALSSEKTIEKTASANKETMDHLTNETNIYLSKILKENQINLMTEKFETLDLHFKGAIASIQTSIEELEKRLTDRSNDEEIKNGKKKGFFGL